LTVDQVVEGSTPFSHPFLWRVTPAILFGSTPSPWNGTARSTNLD
jgi:hypothetical protein